MAASGKSTREGMTRSFTCAPPGSVTYALPGCTALPGNGRPDANAVRLGVSVSFVKLRRPGMQLRYAAACQNPFALTRHYILRGLYGALILSAGMIIACKVSLKEEICRTGS
jgi:hypothetical protein